MGAGGRTTQVDGGEADNVIRFPGNWFGSKEDLVPFGPAADRLEAEQAAARAAAEQDDLVDAISADDFWSSGAGALHQPISLGGDEEAPDDEVLAEPLPSDVSQARRSARVRRPARALAVGVFAALLILGITFALSEHGVHRATASQGAIDQLAAVSTGDGGISAALVADRIRVRDGSIVRSLTRPEVTETKSRPKPKAKPKRGNVKPRHVVSTSTPVTTASTSNASTTSVSESDGSDASQAESVPSSGSDDASGSSDADSLGGIQGSDCNPVCSAN